MRLPESEQISCKSRQDCKCTWEEKTQRIFSASPIFGTMMALVNLLLSVELLLRKDQDLTRFLDHEEGSLVLAFNRI